MNETSASPQAVRATAGAQRSGTLAERKGSQESGLALQQRKAKSDVLASHSRMSPHSGTENRFFWEDQERLSKLGISSWRYSDLAE